METILWRYWIDSESLTEKIRELINQNYIIVSVVPLGYSGGAMGTILSQALIIANKN